MHVPILAPATSGFHGVSLLLSMCLCGSVYLCRANDICKQALATLQKRRSSTIPTHSRLGFKWDENSMAKVLILVYLSNAPQDMLGCDGLCRMAVAALGKGLEYISVKVMLECVLGQNVWQPNVTWRCQPWYDMMEWVCAFSREMSEQRLWKWRTVFWRILVPSLKSMLEEK